MQITLQTVIFTLKEQAFIFLFFPNAFRPRVERGEEECHNSCVAVKECLRTMKLRYYHQYRIYIAYIHNQSTNFLHLQYMFLPWSKISSSEKQCKGLCWAVFRVKHIVHGQSHYDTSWWEPELMGMESVGSYGISALYTKALGI